MNEVRKAFVYLAVPYTHSEDDVKNFRFLVVTALSAKLFERDIFNFSPITHSHPISAVSSAGTSWATWEAFDKFMISLCDQIWVLKIPGWKESVGVTAEIAYALEENKPVFYLGADLRGDILEVYDESTGTPIMNLHLDEESLECMKK